MFFMTPYLHEEDYFSQGGSDVPQESAVVYILSKAFHFYVLVSENFYFVVNEPGQLKLEVFQRFLSDFRV